MGCREALSLLGDYMVRGINDADDADARAELMWAATLAGIAFGNCGVHAPHGMSYAVASKVEDFHASDYPDHKSMVPHGMSVVVTAPSVFRLTASHSPERHFKAAELLGADTKGATLEDAGEVLSNRLIELMDACDMPRGLQPLGYQERDIPDLVEGAYAQQRLLVNAPLEMTRDVLDGLFRESMSY
jgi:alcohol dehydrogenase class IV